MNALATPVNAAGLIAARNRGKRPAEPVVVSFIGRLDWPNPTVYAEPGRRYDWRFLRDLPVIVAVSKTARPAGELRRILEIGPRIEVDRDLILADVPEQRAALVFIARGRVWTHRFADIDNAEFFS